MPSIAAARAATSTVPIVAVGAIDPVGQGWALSLARPGGNVAGLSVSFWPLETKILEVLKEAAPSLARVAVLRVPTEIGTNQASRVLAQAAQALGLELLLLDVENNAQLEAAVEEAVRNGAQAVYARRPILSSPTAFASQGSRTPSRAYSLAAF